MDQITLHKIDQSNFVACFGLTLAAGQEAFVSHPIRSLAQAYIYYHQCTPFGIYQEAQMVGYVMVLYDYDEDAYNIWHLMIDQAHQGKGYGKAAMGLVLDYIKAEPFGSSKAVSITVNPQNTVAYEMYKKMGFAETGSCDEDEVEMRLLLS